MLCWCSLCAAQQQLALFPWRMLMQRLFDVWHSFAGGASWPAASSMLETAPCQQLARLCCSVCVICNHVLAGSCLVPPLSSHVQLIALGCSSSCLSATLQADATVAGVGPMFDLAQPSCHPANPGFLTRRPRIPSMCRQVASPVYSNQPEYKCLDQGIMQLHPM